jgi:hypothetical protein
LDVHAVDQLFHSVVVADPLLHGCGTGLARVRREKAREVAANFGNDDVGVGLKIDVSMSALIGPLFVRLIRK